MQVQTEKRTLVSNSPFSAFINLIALDQEIRGLHEKISELQQTSESLLAQKQELSSRLEQFKQHVHDLKKMVTDQEYELKELDLQERAKKEQLDSLTDIKHYQPLKREIDRLKQTQHEKEQHLMAIWNKLDIAQKEFEEQQTHYTVKLEELHTQLDTNQQQINQLMATLAEKKEERPSKEIGVPDEWLEKYTLMRLRVPDPVVPVMQGGCSACSYPVTEQELIRLKRKALVQCKGCFRLLYMQEAMNQRSDVQDTNDQST
jgi:predicted  nucleic acid-binding Zn-ribbon protein